MATDVVLAWEVWELRFANPLSRIWLIVFMADISAIPSQRVKYGKTSASKSGLVLVLLLIG